MLGVSSNHYVWLDFEQQPVAMVAQRVPHPAWQRLSAGSGSKGRRWFDWAALRLAGAEGGWQRWLLVRRVSNHVKLPLNYNTVHIKS